MYRILPFISERASLPEMVNLPIELWCMILRILDPVSLLKAIQTSPLWMNVCRGDPVLRKTISDQLQFEKQRQQQIERNPGLLIRVIRQEPAELFGKNRIKTVQQLKIEENSTEEIRRVFGKGKETKLLKKTATRIGPSRCKTNVRSQPYRNIRC